MISPARYARMLLRHIYHLPSPTYNHASKRNLRRFAETVATPVAVRHARLLNIGGGGRILSREAVDDAVCAALVNIDVERFPAVACLADAQRLPFVSGSFAGILSTAVLEHLPNPHQAIAETVRVAEPHALLYMEVPFLQGYHASPDDYQRFTGSGLRHLFHEHADVEIGVCVGPSSALSWVARGYVKGLLSGFSRRRGPERFAEFVAAWLTVPIKYLDRWVADRPASEDLASGFYVFARVIKS